MTLVMAPALRTPGSDADTDRSAWQTFPIPPGAIHVTRESEDSPLPRARSPRVETGINSANEKQASHQKSRASQQHERERAFEDNERAPEARSRHTTRRSRAALLEDVAGVAPVDSRHAGMIPQSSPARPRTPHTMDTSTGPSTLISSSLGIPEKRTRQWPGRRQSLRERAQHDRRR